MKPVWILIGLGIIVTFCLIYGSFYFMGKNNNLGQVFNPTVSSFCENNGGVITCSYRQPIRNATTTYCIRETPQATSTLVHVSIDGRTSTGTANTIQIGKSATNNNTSTSTLLATKSVLASERWSLTATSTLDTNDNLLLTPSTATTTKNYIVINGTAGYGSAVPMGSCEFVFRIL